MPARAILMCLLLIGCVAPKRHWTAPREDTFSISCMEACAKQEGYFADCKKRCPGATIGAGGCDEVKGGRVPAATTAETGPDADVDAILGVRHEAPGDAELVCHERTELRKAVAVVSALAVVTAAVIAIAVNGIPDSEHSCPGDPSPWPLSCND